MAAQNLDAQKKTLQSLNLVNRKVKTLKLVFYFCVDEIKPSFASLNGYKGMGLRI